MRSIDAIRTRQKWQFTEPIRWIDEIRDAHAQQAGGRLDEQRIEADEYAEGDVEVGAKGDCIGNGRPLDARLGEQIEFAVP